MTKVFLRKKISRRVEMGHPWIFANEVNTTEGDLTGGVVADVFSHDKRFIGRGYVNPQSQIMVRLLTRDKNEQVNERFFYNRILSAWTNCPN
jgi:23S rRNA (cytosine1962-C5)-methyltransferase